MSLFNELKRRNVIKVAGAYLALAWLVLQLTSIVVPEFGLPAGTMKLVMWLGVIGFPFVVVFSWVYELTPEGLKRESAIDRGQSITPLTGRRLDYAIVVLLVVAIGLFVLQYLRPPVVVPTIATPTITTAPVVQPPAAVSAPSERSIAVLPFADMSEARDQEYFSDGVAEELLNLLAKIPELKVAARTSAFSFKGKDVEIPEIGRRLNVAHVLEGSVRRAGNRLRITVQLIHADDGYHLWSESYDRDMSDIFAVQEEIARTVVAQLKLTLLGPAPRSIATDPEAYALVLKGKHLAAQYSADDLGQAVAAFEQALRIDPTYPMAWVELSWAYVSQLRIGTLPVEQGTRLARVAAEKALALAPDLPLVYERLAYIARVIENDPAAQARYYRQGLELDPQNLELLRGAVFYLVSASRCDEAMNVAHHVIANNPYDPRIHVGLGIALYCVGRQEEAVAKFRHARELSPNYFGIRYQIGLSLLLNHDAAGALEEFRHEPFKAHRLTGNALAFHTLGRKREFEDTMIELEEESSRRPIAIRVAMARAWSGNSNAAFASLEQAAKQHQLELWSLAGSRVFAITLGNDPRWLPFLRTIGQAPEQLAAIKFDVKLPQQ